MRRIAFVLVLWMVACSWALGQITPEMGLGLSFNTGDVNFGMQGGIGIDAIDASVRGEFSARLGSKRVLVQDANDSHLFYQYNESRYYLGVEVEKRVRLFDLKEDSPFGLTGMIMGGYTFGDYHGTQVIAKRGITYRGRIAPYVWLDKTAILRLGYEYLPLPTKGLSAHRIFFSVSFTFAS